MRYTEAESYLLAAYHLENAFYERTKCAHPLRFFTMQSLGDVYRRQKKYNESLGILTEAFLAQLTYYAAEQHPDVAKTLHFMGDTLAAMKVYNQALDKYKRSLAIKEKLYPATDPIRKVTEEAIFNLIHHLNHTFSFDWNNYLTIKPCENQLVVLEVALQELFPIKNALSAEARHELGQLCYKMGTYYNHIQRRPDMALPKLKLAQELLSGNELAWVQNHLAFTDQQQLAAARLAENNEQMEQHEFQGTLYTQQVMAACATAHKTSPEQVEILAFAYCVKALIDYEAGNKDAAVSHYQTAFEWYERIGASHDQYARALSRSAMICSELDHPLTETLFKKAEEYWSANVDLDNPYRARFHESYGDHLAKKDADNSVNLANVLIQYQRALEITLHIYGEGAFAKKINDKIYIMEEKLKNLPHLEEAAKPARPSYYSASSPTLHRSPPVRRETDIPVPESDRRYNVH